MEKYLDNGIWTFWERLIFRFIFLVFLSFIVLMNNNTFFILGALFNYFASFLDGAVIWLGNQLLRTDTKIIKTHNGSGDTSYHFALLYFIGLLSISGTLIWSILDRKSKNYQLLLYWITLLVRFYLGLMLINYGLVKIIKLQFPYPNLTRLDQSFGEASPMGLAWTFFGYSKGYNILIGTMELMGVLLLFRKTVTFGALICLVTTINIMAVNYFYDIPVKIVSTALVVMSLFLLTPNFKRLYLFFIKGKTVSLRKLFYPKIKRKSIYVAKNLIKAFLICVPVFHLAFQVKKSMNSQSKAPLSGVYNVKSFIWKDSLTQDKNLNWTKVIIYENKQSAIIKEGNIKDYCRFDVDEEKQKISLLFDGIVQNTYYFNYKFDENENLNLDGILYDKPIQIKLMKKKYLLMEVPFRWINEAPYNR